MNIYILLEVVFKCQRYVRTELVINRALEEKVISDDKFLQQIIVNIHKLTP